VGGKVLGVPREFAVSVEIPAKAALGGLASPLRKYPPAPTIFHERWWLNAVAGANLREASVEKDGEILGWLPYVSKGVGPFTALGMPPFTHLLGPVVSEGEGKAQSQFVRKKKIIRDLVLQLPRHQHFRQHMVSSDCYGLAFQECGFRVTPQYSFTIDCGKSLKNIWSEMHFKTRQHIRRAEERSVIETVDDPNEFIKFYLRNLALLRRRNQENFEVFPKLFAECRQRGCGQLLCARRTDGEAAAMVFLVWGHGVLYYLLSTRTPEAGDSGSVNLLIWSAIKLANERGLAFDFDGVTSKGTARFLSSFGGEIVARLVSQRSSPLFGALQAAKRRFVLNDRAPLFS
jgi:lipid II:glycine glycyltransferase (peptidoglycan interpeptide bridge formation enzyme)